MVSNMRSNDMPFGRGIMRTQSVQGYRRHEWYEGSLRPNEKVGEAEHVAQLVARFAERLQWSEACTEESEDAYNEAYVDFTHA